jgi:cell division protein ZapA
MQKIKINIANRTYPLSVEEDQEEIVRKSAKKINDAINNYEEKYAVQDKQDSLAMYALQITSQSQDLTSRKEDDMRKINIELNEINNLISDCLKS